MSLNKTWHNGLVRLNSLTLRLTVLIIVVATLTLIVITVTMEQYLSQTVRDEESQLLVNAAAILDNTFQQEWHNSPYMLSQKLIDAFNQNTQTTHFSKLGVLLETQAHHVLFKTPVLDHVPIDTLHRVTHRSQTQPIEWSHRGHDYLLLMHTLHSPTKIQPMYVYLILDISGNNQFIRNFQTRINEIMVLGLLVILLLGSLVTYLGLAPIREMSRKMALISTSDLDKPIDNVAWPHEIRHLARNFEALMNRLKRAFRQLSQFSSDVAHEFRTPITNLRGATEVALMHPREFREYQELLYSHMEEYDRLTEMIDKLLFLAQAEAQETQLHKTQFEVIADIQDVIDYFEPLILDKKIQVNAAGHAIITADQPMLRRLVSNVLSNALKYTAPHGRIDIYVDTLENSATEIRIQDTGCGIAPEHRDQIFDRFYRVDAVRSHSEGTGLGLSIVQSIVALHGGSIHIDSELGKGTTVIVTFPSTRLPKTDVSDAILVVR